MDNDYIIAEDYTLPSKGKVYNKEINPHIRLRSMTTREEMKRLNPSDKVYKNLCEVIDDCLVDKPGISSYDMCLGDYQFLLHKIRVVTYGPDFKAELRCPFCGCTNQRTINLDSLSVNEYSQDFDKYLELDLPKTGKHVKLKLQTPRMLDDVESKAKDLRKKTHNGEPAFLLTLQALIDEVDGQKLNFIQLEDFVNRLPMLDANYILRYSEKANGLVGVDTMVEDTCDVCGLEYGATFRPTQEFFGPSIDI